VWRSAKIRMWCSSRNGDLETVRIPLRIAETGHPHSPPCTPQRFRHHQPYRDIFPSISSRKIRAQLSLVLEGILASP